MSAIEDALKDLIREEIEDNGDLVTSSNINDYIADYIDTLLDERVTDLVENRLKITVQLD